MRIAALLIAAALCARAADIPMTLVSQDEAEPIHSAILRKEAWTEDAIRRLRADAERHMKEGPWTVTSNRPIGAEVDVHQYYSEAPYWWPNPSNPGGPWVRRDGEVNPARFTANYQALNAMCDAVFTLGTAGFLLEDPRYARRAAYLLHVWFVDAKTRMNPNLEHAQAIPGLNEGRGTGIMEGRVFIRAVQGIEFLEQTGSWDARDRAAVHKWFDDYLRWLVESKTGVEERRGGNTQAAWWTAQAAAIAAFAGDAAAQRTAFNYYRDHILPAQFPGGRGAAAAEEMRTRPLAYSVFNLEAMALACRIAQVQGIDLWDLTTRGGSSIATLLDRLTAQLTDPGKPAREQSGAVPGDSMSALAFAGMGMKKPEYITLFRKLDHSESAWTTLIDLLIGRWESAAHQTLH